MAHPNDVFASEHTPVLDRDLRDSIDGLCESFSRECPASNFARENWRQMIEGIEQIGTVARVALIAKLNYSRPNTHDDGSLHQAFNKLGIPFVVLIVSTVPDNR